MKSRGAMFILLAFIFFLSQYAGADEYCPRKITSNNPYLNLPCPCDDPRWQQAFRHWDSREDTKEVMKAIELFESLRDDYPGKLDVWLWLSRSYYVAALRNRGDSKTEMAHKSEAAADRALKLDPQNGCARFWRWAAIILYRQFTDKEFEEIRAFGQEHSHLREMVVPDDDALWQKAMKHWDARYDYEEGPKAIEIFENLERKYPNRIEPKIWLLRANYWMHYIENDRDAKAAWCKKAAEWGNKAREIEPRNPAANYLTASALGQYGTHTSFLNYVRYSLDIAKGLTVTMEEDPNFYYGGISQYLAIAIARAGALVEKTISIVGFDMDLILRSTIYASRKEPRYLRNFLALGELYIHQGKMEQAEEMLNIVINGDPSALPFMEPENRVTQSLAKELLDKHFSM